jgi:hypothetical protein
MMWPRVLRDWIAARKLLLGHGQVGGVTSEDKQGDESQKRLLTPYLPSKFSPDAHIPLEDFKFIPEVYAK